MENRDEQIQILDDLTLLEYDKEEQSRLEDKYRQRTQVEINEPFFKASKRCRDISQIMSLVLGLGIGLWLGDKFPDLRWAILAGTILGLLGWEYAKRYATDKKNEIRILNKSRKVKLSANHYSLALIILVVGSMGYSIVGVPCVLKQFAKHEPLQVLDSVRSQFTSAIAANELKFAAQKKDVKEQIKNIEEKMAYKGTIIRKAQSTYANLQSKAEKKDSILNSHNEVIRNNMHKAVFSAVANNQRILQDHERFCHSFNWFAGFIAIVLDFQLLALSFWISNHEDRKRKENKVKERLLKESKEGPKVPKKGPKEPKVLEDGEIQTFEDSRGNLIGIPKKDGTIKGYTVGGLRNLIKNSSPERQEQLTPYLQTLENY